MFRENSSLDVDSLLKWSFFWGWFSIASFSRGVIAMTSWPPRRPRAEPRRRSDPGAEPPRRSRQPPRRPESPRPGPWWPAPGATEKCCVVDFQRWRKDHLTINKIGRSCTKTQRVSVSFLFMFFIIKVYLESKTFADFTILNLDWGVLEWLQMHRRGWPGPADGRPAERPERRPSRPAERRPRPGWPAGRTPRASGWQDTGLRYVGIRNIWIRIY